jgi:putative membrane-bound dehydrogenase-like protein
MYHRSFRILCLVMTLVARVHSSTEAQETTAPLLHVPDGFIIERADDARTRYPMFAAFDDRGRLFVAESSGLDLYAELVALTRKCQVRMLEDRDGDGRFEKSTVFADKLVFPMGLAWRDSKLYVADPPDLVAYEDTNDDGIGDKRTVILSSFGHRDNGSLHGLVFGPDGWLYMTMGAPDGYKLTRADGTVLSGTSGALIRSRPPRGRVRRGGRDIESRRDSATRRDSSTWTDTEIISRGFVNLVEVAFTPRGDCIGTDNWFQHPQDGKRDALVHLIDGGLYPYEPDTGTRFPVTGDPLPPVALFPAVALSGVCAYRGSAFPADMHGNFFTAQHNSRKIARHVLKSAGSTFVAESFDFVTTDDPDFHPSDVLEAADGSLMVVDTGAWYVQHCPTGRIRKAESTGGIYRVRAEGAAPPKDPWGAAIDWERTPVERLVTLLADPRPAVRDRATLRLAAIGKPAIEPLSDVLKNDSSLTARQLAIWTLADIESGEALVPLREALTHDDPDIVVPAARALATHGDRASAASLTALVKHQSPAIQLAAAEALARCGSPESLPKLWPALAGAQDAFLEHAIVHAIHHLARAAELESALSNANPRIGRAALRLLDQPPRAAGTLKPGIVLGRVQANDPDLRRTATDILARHPDWAGDAMKLLRGWLASDQPSAEEQRGLRSIVLAFQDQPAIQELVAGAISGRDVGASDAQRAVLLATIAETVLPRIPPGWTKGLSLALSDPDAEVRLAALATAAVLQLPELDDQLIKLAEDTSATVELRRQALQAVVRRRPALSPALFQLLTTDLGDLERPAVRLSAAELVAQCRLSDDQLRAVLAAVKDDALVAPSVIMPALRRSASPATAPFIIDYLAHALESGWRPSEAELNETLKAIAPQQRNGGDRIRKLHGQSLASQLKQLEALTPLLAGGDVARGRDVFFGKRATCSACHRIAAEGGEVGPDLTKVGAVRSGRDLLESLVFPSATIAQGFDPYVVTTPDGRTTTGVIGRQTNDILFLRDSSGAEVRFRKDQIVDLQRANISLMPEGLQRPLGNEELRDLLAFLLSLK